MRCAYRMGNYRCPGLEEAVTDRLGRVRYHCATCARRRAGICADCPRRVNGVVGRAVRCAGHQRAKTREDGAQWYARDPQHARAIHRRAGDRYRAKRRGGPPTPKAERYRRLGELRAAALTPERRREIASLGGTSRWAKARTEGAC